MEVNLTQLLDASRLLFSGWKKEDGVADETAKKVALSL
jgi:hypothetical protein